MHLRQGIMGGTGITGIMAGIDLIHTHIIIGITIMGTAVMGTDIKN